MGELLYIKDYMAKKNKKAEYTYAIEQHTKDLIVNQIKLKEIHCNKIVLFRKHKENKLKKEILADKLFIIAYNKMLYDACDNIDEALEIAEKEVIDNSCSNKIKILIKHG